VKTRAGAASRWPSRHDRAMASGARGDHPLTDITLHGLPVYSPEVDALVREIVALATDREQRELADFLLAGPRGRGAAAWLEPRLTERRDRLRDRARERGWEVG
jgi:hypothetical protein